VKAIASVVLVVAAVGACDGGRRAVDPSSGKCEGQDRPQLDCSSEVKYDATNAQGQFSVAGFGGASAAVEQKALREIDKQTGLYIAEARRLCDEYDKCVLDKETYATRSENLRRRLAQVPELLEGLKNAQGDDARREALAKAYRELVPAEARTELQLGFSVLVQRPNEAAMGPVAAAGAIPTGSRVAFVVEVSQPAYVYLFEKSASGSVHVLFPDPRIAVNNPVPTSTPLRIPPDASFKVDDQDIGVESVYVVAALHPVTRLAAAADQARAGSGPTGALTTVTAIDPSCKTRGLQLDTDGPPAGGCVRSRGLTLDDRGAAAGGARASLRATTEAADDMIATVFRFEHTR
jgi:hypothetical protein